MEWIWKFKSLVKLLEHETPLMREWAMKRLMALYPESAGPVAIRCINNPLEKISIAALDYFIEHPQREYADDILKTYSAGSGLKAGMAAKALSLLKDTRLIEGFQKKYASLTPQDLIGYAGSVVHIANLQTQESEAIAAAALQHIAQMGEPDPEVRELLPSLFKANVVAGKPITHLFDFCFTQKNWHPWLLAWLTALGEVCGSWSGESDLVEEHPAGASKKDLPECIEQSLEVLATSGLQKMAGKLRKSFKKGRYAELLKDMHHAMLKLVGDARDTVGPDRLTLWLQAKSSPQRNMAAIDALYTNIHGKDPDAQKMMVQAAFPIFSVLMELRSLIGLDIESLDTKGLLEVFLQERDTVEIDQQISDRLQATPEREIIATTIFEFIAAHPRTQAMDRLMGFLEKNMNVDLAERLLMLEVDSPELDEKPALAASRLGDPALAILPSVIASQKPAPMTRSLELMRRLPCEASVNLLLQHWDKFWVFDKFSLLEVIQSIGDRRFISVLRNELKEGEFQEAQTYRLLCLIHGETNPMLKKIEDEAEARKREQAKTLKRISTDGFASILDQPLNLELKCRRCRRTYTYEVDEVKMLSNAQGDYLISDEIHCKNCEAIDNYERTGNANLAVMGRNLALLAAGDKALKRAKNGPIRFFETTKIGGKVRSIKETLDYYEELLAKKPNHVPYLIGYANSLMSAKRTDDAIPIYHKALEFDPLAVEALVSLGQNAEAYERLEEAHSYLAKAVAVIDRGNYYRVSQDLWDFKMGVHDAYAQVAFKLGKNPDLMYQPIPALPKKIKVGRNDPCSCGSGKKYKKCCLLK